ncbi:mitosis inhibitor protein kinase swe1 [Cryptotrichosporon argae]
MSDARIKKATRPTTWFAAHAPQVNPFAPTKDLALTSPRPVMHPAPIPHSPAHAFMTTAGKHRLSPSPSPRHDDDYIMISPVRPALVTLAANSSSPSSPTPCVASAAAKLNLADESPIRRVPGQSRSLAAARAQPVADMDDSPPPTPTLPSASLFPTLRASQSQDCNTHKIARMDDGRKAASRARSSTDAALVLGKKAVSLDHISVGSGNEPFGSPVVKKRPSRPHRRAGSGTINASELSRSIGHRSGLSLSPALPDLASNSSLSSVSSSSFSPAFDDVKPNQEAFDSASASVRQKFNAKPRDSGVSLETRIPPPSVLKIRPSIASAMPEIDTPSLPTAQSGWPRQAFNFLGEDIEGLSTGQAESRLSMPGTPVKKHSFGHRNSISQTVIPPPSTVKPTAIPEVSVTSSSSPSSVDSPTVRLGTQPRLGMLRRTGQLPSSTEVSEDEGTPTKGGGERTVLARHPTPSPTLPRKDILPRLSLPAFRPPKHRTLTHRQSHPATQPKPDQDIFERRFITLDTIGKGAFSTVLKVQHRTTDEIYAVKKARGVFDGVKDRLRHLEEVDILRHLSSPANPHVIRFADAWEQDRQLFIQTELCLGSLAFFLEEYGRVVERLDEGRVWKIVRELSDGLNHIHSAGVIHFDIKPANVLISATGSLKIADFGLATRWPRVSPQAIIAGSGLGGTAPAESERLEREGDRVYMPPEMLRGVFVQAADIFSFGLVILEVSTNICVPDGGAPWHAIREDDFSVVDLSPLSPALTDLIVKCMAADPERRPTITHIVEHPIVQRARAGKEALAPEDPRWLANVLAGTFASAPAAATDSDVEMQD